jgi:hypothetical protein
MVDYIRSWMENNKIVMYKDVAKNIEAFTLVFPNTTIPNPTKEDYRLGFIYRHFIQKANDENSFIFEVSETEYQRYQSNTFWKTLKLKWRIAGPKDPIYKNGELDDRGVVNSNKSTISIASSDFKNISLYLPNLLQFHKG